jgi:uncharacterized protein (TIGR04255 family)
MNAAVEAVIMASEDRYPHLPKAPIVEAVIDWRVKLASTFEISRLKKLGESLGAKYSLSDEERHFQFGIKQLHGPQAELTSRQIGTRGFRFRSQDGLEIATLSQDGFSFSRLKPYTRWDLVFGEAWRLWELYRSACQPEEISRIAVRYINRILLPLPIQDLGRYLATPPQLPPAAPGEIGSLLFRATSRDPFSNIFTNVTQVIEGLAEDGRMPFILDIDAYIVKTMNPNAKEIDSLFANLREMKNRVFFATLTATAVDMFR